MNQLKVGNLVNEFVVSSVPIDSVMRLVENRELLWMVFDFENFRLVREENAVRAVV